ncbi:hypothetical protein XA68_18282 [Ophiocordyceps unilateralis]|uniref:Uncharacterized protein n=1 Tax=Ophiocordyceps unilateralis TaxID=268505 RepID=A0A2A9PIN4_OPHUN|nr:hypothetical protein XA68_18282 [Ophiocordyceps unilateralis]
MSTGVGEESIPRQPTSRLSMSSRAPPFSVQAPTTAAASATSTQLENGRDQATDAWPASYHYYKDGSERKPLRAVANPVDDVDNFLEAQFSLGRLNGMLKHLWFAGSRRPAMQLHFQVAMGRQIVLADRMDLHLLWDSTGRLFMKPLPTFLLSPSDSPTSAGKDEALLLRCSETARSVALGFLYTYACLICSETDFHMANQMYLLPRKDDDSTIKWTAWKKLAREILRMHDVEKVHPRFQRAELRMSRLNTIHRLTGLSAFDPDVSSWNNYSSLFLDNLTWISAATILIALVLTAMQVGLATDRLKGDQGFQRASYGFTVFAILGPMCAFGLVVLAALLNLTMDLPVLFRDMRALARASVHGRGHQRGTGGTSSGLPP